MHKVVGYKDEVNSFSFSCLEFQMLEMFACVKSGVSFILFLVLTIISKTISSLIKMVRLDLLCGPFKL